jgi:nonsense-mediated mRNA decay protein 3
MRCAQCLKSEVSIVDDISRQVALPHCRNCNRYNKPGWTKCEPESRELLGICLKRVKGIGKDVRLIDAAFIWTEEHSRRIRVKITVQKEVANASVLQQTMVVEFQVVNQQCEECQKSFTPHTFAATVQVRQKVAHRRTFCYLEQRILKHDAHSKVVSLKESREGLDFHFGQRSHAQRFADFISSCVPSMQKNSKSLQAHDASSNIYNYKYTIMTTLCPICVDDVVFVPKGHSDALVNAAPLMLCYKVTNAIRLVDPLTLRGCDIPAESYWKRPLESVLSRQHLIEFVVLNVEPVETPDDIKHARHNLAGVKHGKQAVQLADVEVARACDLGANDDRFIIRSHLGALLKPGHRALGYDLRCVNVSGLDSNSMQGSMVDFILVKRHYKWRRGKRAWELRRLDREREEGAPVVEDDEDMEQMQRDLEEDPELRRGVNLFKSSSAAAAPAPRATFEARQPNVVAAATKEEDEEDEDSPEIPLAELLEGLVLQEE